MADALNGTLYTVDLPYLTQALLDCQNTAEEVNVKLNNLRNVVEETNGYWKGAAASRFQILMGDYDINAARLHSALLSIADAIQTTERNYKGAEQAAHDNVASINLPPANLG
ncbi:hypothetical protein GCM10010129_77090 [Streptomyces fumigatiscleroticus]|nr:hypothetical protein GCM10010129_77090 [Streptomyces fumigatiscleroticus]